MEGFSLSFEHTNIQVGFRVNLARPDNTGVCDNAVSVFGIDIKLAITRNKTANKNFVVIDNIGILFDIRSTDELKTFTGQQFNVPPVPSWCVHGNL